MAPFSLCRDVMAIRRKRARSAGLAIHAHGLDSVSGGLRLQNLPFSPNVIDMAGAPPLRGMPKNYGNILANDFATYERSGSFEPYEPISPAARDIFDRIENYHRTYGRPVSPPPPGSLPPDPGRLGPSLPRGALGTLEDQLGFNDMRPRGVPLPVPRPSNLDGYAVRNFPPSANPYDLPAYGADPYGSPALTGADYYMYSTQNAGEFVNPAQTALSDYDYPDGAIASMDGYGAVSYVDGAGEASPVYYSDGAAYFGNSGGVSYVDDSGRPSSVDYSGEGSYGANFGGVSYGGNSGGVSYVDDMGGASPVDYSGGAGFGSSGGVSYVDDMGGASPVDNSGGASYVESSSGTGEGIEFAQNEEE